MKLKEAEQLHDISPHLRTPRKTQHIMLDVVIALTPAFIGSIYFFGYNSIVLVLSAVIACVLSEYVWQKLRKEKITVGDFSAVVTGILLAFNMPVTSPAWVVVLASIFAIVVVKQMFGGIGSNFANPALMGRAFIVLLYPGAFAKYVTTYHNSVDSVSSATVLTLLKSGKEISEFTTWDMFIGNIPGAIGETSALLLLLGFSYLCYRKIVNIGAASAYLITVIAMTFIFGRDGLFTGNILVNLFGGGLILGTCYMITDYPSVAPRVKVTLAIIAGLITAGLRIWGVYSEGVCYGILVANCLSGLVDRVLKPHIYGVGVKRTSKQRSS